MHQAPINRISHPSMIHPSITRFIQPAIEPAIQKAANPFSHPSVPPFIRSAVYSSIKPFFHQVIHSSIWSSIFSSIIPSIHPSILSFIYPLTKSVLNPCFMLSINYAIDLSSLSFIKQHTGMAIHPSTNQNI